MIRGFGPESGERLGELLRAHPTLFSLVTEKDTAQEWVPAALRDRDSELSAFLRENGFSFAFSVIDMLYEGKPFPEPALPFSAYHDSDYEAAQELISRSFYELRRAVNIAPYYVAPSQEARERFAQHAKDQFILRQGGKIIGFANAIGNEVDDVCVDEGHRGQGLGAALVMHCSNHILQKGQTSVELSVIGWNTGAHVLYRKLGFTDKHTTYLFRNSDV